MKKKNEQCKPQKRKILLHNPIKKLSNRVLRKPSHLQDKIDTDDTSIQVMSSYEN